MNKIKLMYVVACCLLAMVSCTKKDGIDADTSFLNSAASAKNSKIFDISTDNSGNVTITPLADGASSYIVAFGHGTGSAASATVLPGYNTTHAYPEGTYTVSITSVDIAGHQTTATYPLTVTYRAPQNLIVNNLTDMQVKATALYAKSFLVYYGDVTGETGTPMAIGQTLPAHIYPAGGPYTLRVVALSGGAATTTYTKTLFGPPIDFETATVNYFFGSFGTGQQFSTVANPSATGLNTSAKVGMFTHGSESWSGTYSPLDIPINFALGTKVKLLVYNPSSANIGKKLNVELEAAIAGTGATANGVGVLKIPLTTSAAWEELVFDFSTIPSIASTARFGQLVFRFNDAVAGTGEVIYIDNIRVTN
ncbi:MAG: hypothetical protein QM541_00070 [Flavobacterium sp.]|nr:hypothetical protein [Flavobacterium sp.]